MEKYRFDNKAKNFHVLLVICLWVNVFLCPQAALGSEQTLAPNDLLIKEKVPAFVLQKLAAGQFQDLIVEFEHQDIRGEAAVRRKARRLQFNDNQIVALTTARYRARKKRIFDVIQQSEFKIIQDYKHLPLAFVRIKSKRAAELLGSLAEVKSIQLNQKFYPHLS